LVVPVNQPKGTGCVQGGHEMAKKKKDRNGTPEPGPMTVEIVKPDATPKKKKEMLEAVMTAYGKSNEAVVECGRLLLAFKQEISEKSFEDFMDGLPFSGRQGYRMIAAYRVFNNLPSDKLSQFDTTALYKLAGPGKGRIKDEDK